MANTFATHDIAATQDTPLTVKSGVQEDQTLIPALTKPVTELVKEFATDEGDGTMSRFINSQLAIGEAVKTGSMSVDAANIKMRANVAKYVANNPALAEDFLDAHSKIVNTAGLAKVAVEGTKQYQQEQAELKAARDSGYIYPENTPEEQKLGLEMYRTDQALKRTVEQESKIVGLASSKVGLSSAEMARDASQRKYNSQRMLELSIEKERNRVNLNTSSIMKRLNLPSTNPNAITKEEALAELDLVEKTIQEQLTTFGQFAEPGMVTMLANPSLEYINNLKSVVSEGRGREVAENTYNKTLKIAQSNLVQDKELLSYVAMDNLWRNGAIDIVTAQKASEFTLRLLVKGSNKDEVGGKVNPDIILNEDKASVGDYLEMNKKLNSAYAAGKLNEDEQRQLINQNETILKTVADLPNRSPDEYKQVVNYLASPSFGAFVKKNGGLPAGAQEANLVLERQYREEVLPLIQDEITNQTLRLTGGKGGRDVTPLKDLVDIRYIAGGVQFSAKPNAGEGWLDKSLIRNYVDNLNKTVSPQMSLLTNMSSNFNQSSPQSELEALRAAVFPEVTGTQPEQRNQLTEEEMASEPQQAPSLTKADADYIMAGDTAEEKARRAGLMGINPADIDRIMKRSSE